MRRAAPPALPHRERCREIDRSSIRATPAPSAIARSARNQLETWGGAAKLIVLPSPFRSLMEPLLEYIGEVEEDRPDDYVTIILPEFVPARWWQHLLDHQRALLIKGALLFRPNTVVTSVPFHLTK